jgi:hypothetical protein
MNLNYIRTTLSYVFATVSVLAIAAPAVAIADEALSSVDKRFAADSHEETPDFQKHVIPTMTRLGCNARACHGSFQGRGGFRLSLFGYDFKADHEALMVEQDEPRVNTKEPAESLIIAKPTDADMHEGGKRYDKGGWQHHLLSRWIEAGAVYEDGKIHKLSALEVTPAELLFTKAGEQTALRVVAVWEDGAREDVTPICRFETNDETVAEINVAGVVTSREPGDTHVVVYYDNGITPVPIVRPFSPQHGEKYPKVAARTTIDRHVIGKLSKLGVLPSDVCTDAEFLRRVSLDLAGTLPTPAEIEAFLADASKDKRQRKVDELLETAAYAAWWTTRLCDITGNNDGALNNVTPVRGQASQEWYDWIYQRVADNAPYDELAAGLVTATSRRKGQTYTEYCEEMSGLYHEKPEGEFADRESMPYYWARRTLRQPEERAISFAHTFLGIRIQCAQCHKHPFDQWSKSDFDNFKGFFTRVVALNNGARESREEYDAIMAKLDLDGLQGGQARQKLGDLVRKGATVPFPEVAAIPPRPVNPNSKQSKNRNRGGAAPAATAKLLGGDTVDLNQFADARQPLLDWLRSEENPFFARAFVNRVWANYFNVGIVEPPDNLSLANPPSNKPLLDYLADGFIKSGYDMKWLHREIVGSDAYQRSWRPNDTNRLDSKNFSRAIPRRLPAEVAYDAVRLATSSDEEAVNWRADIDRRAIGLPGSGYRGNNRNNYALMIFGRSVRENNCDCDRSMDPSLLQTVYLQNDQEVYSMLEARKNSWVEQVGQRLDVKGRRKDGAGRPADFAKQIAAMQRKIVALRKAKDTDKAKAVERKLADYRKKYQSASQSTGTKVPTESFDVDAIVREAYLRTLSRPPRAEELARSREFIASSDDTLDGVSGLLWALINTKEFIVNH